MQVWGPVTVDMFSWLVDDGAQYQGQYTIDGVLTNMWNASTGTMHVDVIH